MVLIGKLACADCGPCYTFFLRSPITNGCTELCWSFVLADMRTCRTDTRSQSAGPLVYIEDMLLAASLRLPVLPSNRFRIIDNLRSTSEVLQPKRHRHTLVAATVRLFEGSQSMKTNPCPSPRLHSTSRRPSSSSESRICLDIAC